jgi:hypothetical protein
MLLKKCIEYLPKDTEICVAEIGRERHIKKLSGCKYRFFEYNNNINHRGWALNLGVKKISTGNKLILLDADIIVNPYWYEEVKKCKFPAVAWGTMHYLNKDSTKRVLKDDLSEPIIAEKVKYPRLDGPAGGISVIDREIFYKIKGVPENFENTWGGPDNTFFAKLRSYGYPFKCLRSSVIHLYHTKNTPRNLNIALKARDMLRWSKEQWDKELERIGDNWGEEKWSIQ